VDSLDRALDGAHAVINCAGPLLEIADAVAAAAVRTGIHYLDVTAEQPSTRATLDTYDVSARNAGVAVVPAMGFYGGFADLLVTAALGDWNRADTIEIMIRSRQLASDTRHADYRRAEYGAAHGHRGRTADPSAIASCGKRLGVWRSGRPSGRG
jgi:short subunit dehydrogenase-like uncharacterized protein